MNNILITICARGGSKGIPGKNIKLLNGLPLISYTIRTAKKFVEKYGADLALSSDSEEIKAVSAKFGLNSDYQRPPDMATDTAGKIGAIKHLWHYQEQKTGKTYDFVIDMDVTSPMRNLQDLECAFSILCGDREALNIFSVNQASRNPYFNMVERKENGYYDVVKQSSKPIKSRQVAPEVFDMNASFYIYRRSFFTGDNEVAKTKQSLIYRMPHICFDLDEPIDFTIMEIMLREDLLDFNL